MFSKWRNRLRRTLGLRLAFWYAAVFIASTGALTILTYALLAASLEQRDHDSVAATLTEYASEYATGGLEALAVAVTRAERDGRHERLFVRVLNEAGTAVYSSVPPEWGQFDIGQLVEETRDGNTIWATAPSEGLASRLEVAFVGLPDGVRLQVGKSTANREELLRRFRSLLGAVVASIFLLGVGGGVLVTRSTLRPAHRLAATVRSIIETGHTEARVQTEASGDPLDELGSLVNTMLDRIMRLVEGMRDALDNVAHDLRTPLARLRARAEAALTMGDPVRRDEVLADCIAEADRISATLDTLMDIAEARTGTLALHVAPVQIGPLVDEIVDLYADTAGAKGVSLAAAIPRDLVLSGDVARLREVIANVVDNAIKYTETGGEVAISAARQGNEIAITVRDTGVGIDAEDLPRIWDRLYRSDRSRSSRGLGLGLSVVKAFVEAHGGRVSAESAPQRGTLLSLHLPLGQLSSSTATSKRSHANPSEL